MRFYQVDAFTREIFKGNPAGVCIVQDADDGWMQRMADEIHASETAFLTPVEDGYALRWFAPDAEVDLCGHATLASAHILYSEGYADPALPLTFHTKSGTLRARLVEGMIELDFPAEPPEPADPPLPLIEALGMRPVYTGRNRMDYMVEIEDAQALRRLRIDFSLLQRVDTRGLIVTARDTGKYDFISRFFAPRIGIPEDPVTGSAHCCLVPYWSRVLGRETLHACQVSARGGELWLRLAGGRVYIRGYAVTVYTGEMR